MLEKNFVITAELQPPKGPDTESFIKKAKLIKPVVDAVNVTDNQRAIVRLSSLAGCVILERLGITPVMQLTCRDRNRLAIQSDLFGAQALGIRHILALTGDDISAGDHVTAKQVYDIDSLQLISLIENLNNGINAAGNKLSTPTEFTVGAAVNPFALPEELTMLRFEKKISAGAKFFQTQAVYDMDAFASFMKKTEAFNVKIFAGILLLKSAKMADFLNRNLPGVHVPQDLIDELQNATDPLEKGIEIAARSIRNIKDIAHGVHIMAMGMEERIPDIMELV